MISRYLSQLAVAAAGQDSALVNDILADAEQHLWNAVGDGVPAEQAVVEFGDPKDVVAAYLASSGRARPTAGGARQTGVPLATISGGQVVAGPAKRSGFRSLPVVGVWADRYAWGSLALFIFGFALATAYFVVVTTWGAFALGTIILIIGFPLLVGLLGFSRVVALGHGWLIEVLTGVRMPRRTAPVAGEGMASFWGRIRLWLSDGRSWLSVAFLLGNFPVATLLFTVFVTLVAAAKSLMLGPVLEAFTPDEWFQNGNGFHLGPWWHGGRLPLPIGLLAMALGFAIFTGTLWLAKGCGWLYAQVAKAIQVTRPVRAGPVQTVV
ncbi:MAG: sensor domain-containing protein [Phycisphaerales bacterium]|nr:sensor domain-containing protein [Phycisphaerales bacterium]